jgi:ubiquitin carboxyl-terminal hydrolase L5
MLQYEETQLSFNLLALCRSPLVGYTVQIARAISSLRRLLQKMSDNTGFKAVVPSEEPPLDPNADYSAGLPEFNLSATDIEQTDVLEHVRDALSRSDLSVDEAVNLHRDLVIEIKAAIGEYRAELLAMADDDRRVQGRKRDFGPALHKWVTKLAEKGVLENIIKETG